MDRKRKIIIIVTIAVLAVALIIAIIFKAISPTEDPKKAYLDSAIKTTIDKDTGDQITVDPNLGPQTDEARTVTILGMEAIVRTIYLSDQINYIKDAINTFSKERLDNKYETITIRPQDLLTNEGVTTTTIRLGQSDEILPIKIIANDIGETQVIISDPQNKYGGIYESKFTVFEGE